MEARVRKMRSGLTPIEIMIGLVVIIGCVFGEVMYRYHAAVDARMADVHTGTGRVALLIPEGWKGAAGADDYDPQAVGGLAVEVLASGSTDISEESNDVYTVDFTGDNVIRS